LFLQELFYTDKSDFYPTKKLPQKGAAKNTNLF